MLIRRLDVMGLCNRRFRWRSERPQIETACTEQDLVDAAKYGILKLGSGDAHGRLCPSHAASLCLQRVSASTMYLSTLQPLNWSLLGRRNTTECAAIVQSCSPRYDRHRVSCKTSSATLPLSSGSCPPVLPQSPSRNAACPRCLAVYFILC